MAVKEKESSTRILSASPVPLAPPRSLLQPPFSSRKSGGSWDDQRAIRLTWSRLGKIRTLEKEGRWPKRVFFRLVSAFVAVPILAFITIASGVLFVAYQEYFLYSLQLYRVSYVLLLVGTMGLVLSSRPSADSPGFWVPRYDGRTRFLGLLLAVLAAFPLSVSFKKDAASIPPLKMQIANVSSVPIPLERVSSFAAADPLLPFDKSSQIKGKCRLFRRNWMGVGLPPVIAPNTIARVDAEFPDSDACVDLFNSSRANLTLSIRKQNGTPLQISVPFTQKEFEKSQPMLTMR